MGDTQPTNNAVRQDASPLECSGAFATGCSPPAAALRDEPGGTLEGRETPVRRAVTGERWNKRRGGIVHDGGAPGSASPRDGGGGRAME